MKPINPRPFKVLLIEDNPGDVRLIRAMLAEKGSFFVLEHVDRLTTGVARLQEQHFDAVLLDLSLPDAQGLDTFDRTATLALNVPIIVLTGFNDETLATAAIHRGAQDYLIKDNVNGDTLVRAIRHAVERHQLLRELQASEARFRKIITGSADGIIVIDQHYSVCFINPAAEALLEAEPDQLLGERFGYPLLIDSVTEIDLLVSGKEERVVEMHVVESEWEGHPAYLASLRDVTAHKRLVEAEHALTRMRDEFIANVSHELCTPLFAISGAVKLLQKPKSLEPALQQEFITIIANNAVRLKTLVDDLLDLSRLEAGLLPLELKQFDLTGLINDTLHSLKVLATAKHITLTQGGPAMPLQIKADRHRLQQVLVNLIGNAIKFSPDHRSIHIAVEETPAEITVQVHDEGPGIPAEAIPRLFDKFYQINGSNRHAYGGTGLGLYISKRIIESHGGHIGVTSQLGQGSIFYFVLPT
ncbi:MAG: response regulator [Caldilineaceae bacterium]|nr:response regulator [Caldilineaceae bacterium]